MSDLAIYFEPIKKEKEYPNESLGSKIIPFLDNFPKVENKSIVIFDCPEYRNGALSDIVGRSIFREYLYHLSYNSNFNFQIYDLGTILPGKEVKDTYYALKEIVSILVKKECLPIIIGGSQDLTYSIYQGYQKLEQTVNISGVDLKFDLGDPEVELNENNYISHILTTRPCTLFNYSIIGTQQPFLKQTDSELIDKLYFDQCRLGNLVSDFKKAEPLIRNSDILTFDLNAITALTQESFTYSNPNGITPALACQIAKYAGISDKLSCLLISGYFEGLDTKLYSNLVAQMIWYFLDGVAMRVGDFPVATLKDYTKFTVKLIDRKDEIVFYRSNKSDRWWMEVPYPKEKHTKFNRHSVVPCNYEDYLQAMKNDMPDLWWKTMQKLM